MDSLISRPCHFLHRLECNLQPHLSAPVTLTHAATRMPKDKISVKFGYTRTGQFVFHAMTEGVNGVFRVLRNGT
ncbi:hypothetical protein DK66_3097 [Brucella suis 1330]|nr:hypothetical protein DK66_3097 [Brucella suis 1330]